MIKKNTKQINGVRKKSLFPYTHLKSIFRFLDIITTLTCLKINTQFYLEAKKSEVLKLIKSLKEELISNISIFPLNYILAYSAQKLESTLNSFKEKYDYIKYYRNIEIYVGRWIFYNYIIHLFKDDSISDKSNLTNRRLNINLSSKSISTRGFQYLFLSLICLVDSEINLLNLSSNNIKSIEANSINEYAKNIKFKLNHLDISNNQIDDSCFNNLSCFIERLNISSLNLSKNLLIFNDCVNHTKFSFLKNIIELDLSYNKLTSTSSKFISFILSKGSNVKDLNLEGNDLEMEGVKSIIDIMISNKDLELLKLNISRNRIGVDGTIYVSKLFYQENCKLVSLDISHNKIEGLGAKTLCDSLIRNKYLEDLNLKGNAINSFDQNSVKIMYETLISNNIIKKINLAYNSIDDRSIFFLANSLLKNKTLETLILDNNRITDRGAIYLAESFKKGCSLKEISLKQNLNFCVKPFVLDVQNINNLSLNVIGNDSISSNQSLALVIKFSSIVKLNLSDNLYNSEDLRIICTILAEKSNFLKELNLSSNKINAEGAQYLSEFLNSNQNIVETLILSDNDLDEDGAIYIAESIKNNNYLKVLKVDNNNLSWPGIQALIEGFKNNLSCKIEHLDIKKNHITDKGIPFINLLIESWEYYRKIKELDLSYNDITDDGFKIFSKALSTNTTLEKIILKGNKFGRRSAEYLIEHLNVIESFDRVEIDYQQIV